MKNPQGHSRDHRPAIEGKYGPAERMSHLTRPSAELWAMCVQLTDAEAAFRTCKSDPVLRPIWHPHGSRVEAHILICFLAYVLWKTLQQWTQANGLGSAPRALLDELRRHKSTDVLLPTEGGRDRL